MAAPAPKLHVDRSGIVRAAPQIPSPNFDERPPGTRITLLVVHAISLPPGEFGGPWIVELFTNRLNTAAHPYFALLEGQKLSAHFLIRREGSIAQFVPCALRAWHAGLSSWRGRDQCNDYSVGIELEGTDDIPYTDLQYAALAALTRALKRRYPIRDVVGHCDIAPGRKTDPGASFDWKLFRRLSAPRRRRIAAAC